MHRDSAIATLAPRPFLPMQYTFVLQAFASENVSHDVETRDAEKAKNKKPPTSQKATNARKKNRAVQKHALELTGLLGKRKANEGSSEDSDVIELSGEELSGLVEQDYSVSIRMYHCVTCF